MYEPLMWAIWIGPQQQHEPNGVNQGCDFTYPYWGNCPTNLSTSFEDIVLRNITSTGDIFSAGVVLCDKNFPCKNITFDDVNIKSPLFDLLGKNKYIVENAEGSEVQSVPDPNFKPNGYYSSLKNEAPESETDIKEATLKFVSQQPLQAFMHLFRHAFPRVWMNIKTIIE